MLLIMSPEQDTLIDNMEDGPIILRETKSYGWRQDGSSDAVRVYSEVTGLLQEIYGEVTSEEDLTITNHSMITFPDSIEKVKDKLTGDFEIDKWKCELEVPEQEVTGEIKYNEDNPFSDLVVKLNLNKARISGEDRRYHVPCDPEQGPDKRLAYLENSLESIAHPEEESGFSFSSLWKQVTQRA